MNILSVKNLTKKFSGLTAVNDVSIDIKKGQLVGLIGPNGAGKTTLFNILTGIYPKTSGSITLYKEGQEIDISNKTMDEISKIGISRTFQNIRLFKNMTVLENILTAMLKDLDYNFLDSVFKTKKYQVIERKAREKALKLLEITNLLDLKDEYSNNLPYGKQRMLEIARALATNCEILFLDEPAAGLNPRETGELVQLIFKIQREFDLTVILIEHDMSLVMKICDYIYVLNYGSLIAQGVKDEILNNPIVIESYLGKD